MVQIIFFCIFVCLCVANETNNDIMKMNRKEEKEEDDVVKCELQERKKYSLSSFNTWGKKRGLSLSSSSEFALPYCSAK